MAPLSSVQDLKQNSSKCLVYHAVCCNIVQANLLCRSTAVLVLYTNACLPCMQISAKYQPKTPDGQQWMTDYHAKLYNLTDEAIRGAALPAVAGHSVGHRQL
jgi:hypothetical protein